MADGPAYGQQTLSGVVKGKEKKMAVKTTPTVDKNGFLKVEIPYRGEFANTTGEPLKMKAQCCWCESYIKRTLQPSEVIRDQDNIHASCRDLRGMANFYAANDES